jgi:hypothetical protein
MAYGGYDGGGGMGEDFTKERLIIIKRPFRI